MQVGQDHRHAHSVPKATIVTQHRKQVVTLDITAMQELPPVCSVLVGSPATVPESQ